MLMEYFDKEFVLGFITGVLSGLFVHSIITTIKKIWLYRKRKLSENNAKLMSIDYNPLVDDVRMLAYWSYDRQLVEKNMKIIEPLLTNKPKQNYISYSLIKSYAKEFEKKNHNGPTAYLTNYIIDNQDHSARKQFEFKIKLVKSDFIDHLAVGKILSENEELKSKLKDLIIEDPLKYFKTPVPSCISTNVIVISELNNVLAIQRSSTTPNLGGYWSIGIHETFLEKSFLAGDDKNFFGLSRRALTEELRLFPNNYHGLFISWMGINLKNMATYCIAITRLKEITESEVIENIKKGHGSNEIENWAWLPFDLKSVKNFIENDAKIYNEIISKVEGVDISKVRWLNLSKIGLYEAYRVKDYLNHLRIDNL